MDSGTPKPWGRLAIFGLSFFAFVSGQAVSLAALIWWYQLPLTELSSLASDGVALTIATIISAPVEILLLVLFSGRIQSAARYLGWIWPRRSHVVFGVICVTALWIVGDVTSWLTGYDIVSPFQINITKSAREAGWLLWLLLAIIVVAPISEETLFRGFLFRGWLKSPREVWPVIGATSLVFAMLHVQYDLFGITQVLAIGLLLGWLRWVSGSSILTMIMHGLFNLIGVVETLLIGL